MSLAGMWHFGLDRDLGREEDLGPGPEEGLGPGHITDLGQGVEKVAVAPVVVVPVVVVGGATLVQSLGLTIEREQGEGATQLLPLPRIPLLVLVRPPARPPALGHGEGAETSGGGGAVAEPEHL